MTKKKCPKCGEDNPPEAVMCWACYTPLSGESSSSPAPNAATKKSLAAVAAGDEEKKKIAPWQMGVVGVAVAGLLFVGVRTMMPPVEEEVDTGAETTASTTPSSSNPPPPAPAPPPPAPGIPAPPAPVAPAPAPAPAGVPAPTPKGLPYKVVVAPNPRQSIATMAILPNDGTATGAQAASLAAFSRRQYKARLTKRWSTLYIYVFSDKESADYFARYMKRRKGRTLMDEDYTYLSALWSSVLARYTYTTYKGQRVERILYPSKDPNGWWTGRSA